MECITVDLVETVVLFGLIFLIGLVVGFGVSALRD